VDALPPGSRTRVTDTRKTTPGLRVLERYAVRTGGAHSHRDNLGSAVLIKDNHIVAAGGIQKAVERARKLGPHTSRIEVEVENLNELDIALEAKADIILLDNFALDALREAVRRTSGRAILEASGGINLETIAKVAATGVDVISVGALTRRTHRDTFEGSAEQDHVGDPFTIGLARLGVERWLRHIEVQEQNARLRFGQRPGHGQRCCADPASGRRIAHEQERVGQRCRVDQRSHVLRHGAASRIERHRIGPETQTHPEWRWKEIRRARSPVRRLFTCILR